MRYALWVAVPLCFAATAEAGAKVDVFGVTVSYSGSFTAGLLLFSVPGNGANRVPLPAV